MNIRFLLACDTLPTNPWNRDRLPAIIKASEGMDFHLMDIFEFNSREEAHEIHKKKADWFFHGGKTDLRELNRKFYTRVKSYNCNVLVLGTCDNYAWFLLPETVEMLRKDGIFVVGILGDDEFSYKRNRLYVPAFDKVIAYVREYVDYFNSLKPECCYYIPNSCFFPEPNFKNLQVEDEKKKFDVMFMGAPFGIRPNMIRALLDGGVGVSLFGSPQWKQFDDLKAYYHGFLASKDVAPAIRASKIFLATLEDHLTGALHMNTKPWDAVKNGQMCIMTRYTPFIEDYGFIDNKDIVMYDSIEDLVNKAKYYLDHPSERTQVAKNLFNKTKKKFDYTNLYRKLFHDMEEDYLKKQKRNSHNGNQINPKVTIIDLSDSRKEYTGFNMLNISRMAGRKMKLKKNYQELIKTPYVIQTHGGFTYSPYLNKLVDLFPDAFVDGKAYLPNLSSLPYVWIKCIVDIDAVVWEKDAFFEQRISKGRSSRYFYNKHCNFSFGNMRLCDTSEARLAYRGVAFMERCAHGVKRHLEQLLKRGWG